jgi:NAD-dependent deacetylase
MERKMDKATDTDRLADLLRDASRVLVFTGAGISTRSGISDYRGPTGVWKTRRPVYLREFLESAAARDEYWDMKLEAWPSIRDAAPNAVHAAAVDLEQAGRLEAVVTQNIDGLHGKAGTSPERLVEIHGTESYVSCLACGARREPDPVYAEFARTREPPRCDCGGWLKPATISFGQALREEDVARAVAAAAAADLVVSLGSTLSVHPAAGIPLAAADRGVPYAIVNRGATDHDDLPSVTLRVEGDVAEVFPAAVAAALG